MGWIRIRMDPELGKFKAGSGLNHSGSTTLDLTKENSKMTCKIPYVEYKVSFLMTVINKQIF